MSENVKKYLTILYPNYESATKEEQEKIKRDKEFIEKNINAINEYVQRYGQNGHKGMDDNKFLSTIINAVKVDNYFEMLHPDRNTFSPGQELMSYSDKIFIETNFDKIEEEYQKHKNEGADDKEIIVSVIKNLQVDKYFSMLYPNLEELNPGLQLKLMDDRMLIADNINDVNSMYIWAVNNEREKIDNKIIMRAIVNHLKNLKIDNEMKKRHEENDGGISIDD